MENVSTNQSLDKLTFNRLTRLYILALSAIAFSIVISHVIIDYQISNQKKDSYLINISGRQRMLSQKLSKETFLFKDEEDLVQRNFYVTSLKQTLNLWSESHQILIDNENRNGSLQIVRNSCEAIEKGYRCTLSILSEDMILTDKGNYVRPVDATESLLMIEYKTNSSNDKIVGPVRLIIAG